MAEWDRDRISRRIEAELAALESSTLPYTQQYRPDLPRPVAGAERAEFGPRHDLRDGAKGYGWLGPMQARDGNVMTEFSMTDRGRDFPALVPTLNRAEVDYLLTAPDRVPSIPTQERALDQAAYQKAREFAGARERLGLSPFID